MESNHDVSNKKFNFLVNAFAVLNGKEEKLCLLVPNGDVDIWKEKTNIHETTIFLTEENFKNNIHKVFPHAPPFFGKLLYVYMSGGYDRSKISLHRFAESLFPLVNPDMRFNQNKIAFDILDLDHDKCLNIQNLFHLHENVNATSKFGSEIVNLIEYFR